jgi:hypothetical protein
MRFRKLSCDERPDGSGRRCQRNDVAEGSIPIRLITGRHSLFPSSCSRPPWAFLMVGLPWQAKGRVYRVPPKQHEGGRFRLFSGGLHVPVIQMDSGLTSHSPFWFKPVNAFGLFPLTKFIDGSRSLTLSSSLAPFRVTFADTAYPRGCVLSQVRMGYIVLAASYASVAGSTCASRLLPREQQVSLPDLWLKQLLRRLRVAHP